METDLDLVIDTPAHTVDMKSGLTSMEGVSDAVRIIAETAATNNVPTKNTSRNSIRTNLKKNFKSSYGQVFSIKAYTKEAKEQLTLIGKDTLAEIISYYLSEAFYQDFMPPSKNAQKVIDSLGDTSNNLIKTLRKQTLIDKIHNVSNNFGYEVKVRYRKTKSNIVELQKFNQESYAKMAAEESKKITDLEVLITRFNTFTGNGRLQIKGKRETVAFGFTAYKTVDLQTKKLFSRNLDDNNGITKEEEKKHLKIKATSLQKKDGDIVKYLVRDSNV